ncbi:MAG: acyltransferase [Variovorax sp.]|nr:MAG: acyltransferase [Variovorax sp.]
MPLLDAIKALACLVIVGHHLTRYGPMSEVAYPLAPDLIHWLSNDGRLAVQVFLVLAGFLAAGSLAPEGRSRADRTLPRIAQRYARLVMPYLAALSFSLVVALIVRPWLSADIVPAPPTFWQLCAHGLLLQDLLGYSALSAGVWYVAIDFQLFVLALVAVGSAAWLEQRWPAGSRNARWLTVSLVLALATGSLVYFNRHSELDITALYFFGAYGIGMLTYWIGRATRPGTWRLAMLLLAALGLVALALDWRSRIAVALVTALGLALAQRSAWLSSPDWPAWTTPLLQVGRMSYSLFLIHFPVILLVNAAFVRWVPDAPWIDAIGMLLALTASLAAASVLYRCVETRPASWRAVLGLFAGLVACGLLVSL